MLRLANCSKTGALKVISEGGSVVSIVEVKNGSTFNLSSQAFQDNDYVLLEGLMSADSDGVDGVIGHVKLVSENQIQIYADVGASSLRPSGGFATRIITEYSSSQEIQAIESITSDGFTAQKYRPFPSRWHCDSSG